MTDEFIVIIIVILPYQAIFNFQKKKNFERLVMYIRKLYNIDPTNIFHYFSIT